MANKNNYTPSYSRYATSQKGSSVTKKSNNTFLLVLLALLFIALIVVIIVATNVLGGNDDNGTTVDYDLSKLSKTVVQGQITAMQNSPSQYVGKTVKISGDFVGGNYPMVSVGMDSTGCCSIGLEFVLSNGNYPTSNVSGITVVGTFQTYMENGHQYCHLVNAVIL